MGKRITHGPGLESAPPMGRPENPLSSHHLYKMRLADLHVRARICELLRKPSQILARGGGCGVARARTRRSVNNTLCTLPAGRVMAGTADLTDATVPRQHRLTTATAVSLCARKAGWVVVTNKIALESKRPRMGKTHPTASEITLPTRDRFSAQVAPIRLKRAHACHATCFL